MIKDKQKILFIGAGGGREHALAWKIAHSPYTGELFFARGNAGTAQLGTNLDIKETDSPKLLEFAKKEGIDLVLVISDDPLSIGMVDDFEKEGFRVWGPSKQASKLEWSKAFSKDFMQRHNLPTASFKIFTDFEEAKTYIENHPLPIVVKASGLALGKGVIIAQTKDEALKATEDMMVKKVFGQAGAEVVIEEFMEGPEVSIHIFSDGTNYKLFPPSQDHKKIGEGDLGLNTGGVGTIAPLPFLDESTMKQIEEEIVIPTMAGLKKDGLPFVGILYPGLMLTSKGPRLLEFNARFGDPETEVYMRLLETDLLEIIDASIDGRLNEVNIIWGSDFACNIVLVSGGYPENYEKGKIIEGIENAEKIKDVVVFHAGTKLENNKVLTNGGRVLGISATGDTLESALATAYKAIESITFEKMEYRKDIGKKALNL